MYTLLAQLYGQTIRFLRGDRTVRLVSEKGDISTVTWRRWEKGQQLPQRSQVPKLIQGLGCTRQQFEMVFLAQARTELGQRRTQQLRLTAFLIPDFADVATGFEESMTLQQNTLEAFEALAANLGLMERFTDAEPYEFKARSSDV